MTPKEPIAAQNRPPARLHGRTGFITGCLVIAVLGLYVRCSGIWRGLDHDVICHPDSPKQVVALQYYLAGQKVWYMDSLFYDGYPYGLNVVDKQIVSAFNTIARPLTRLVNPSLPDTGPPSREQLHYWANLLRVLYGMIVLALTMLVVHRLTRSRSTTALVALMAAMAPLSSTVTHSATGDIGVDLFVMSLITTLVLLARQHAVTFVPTAALAGLFAGMAFGCKYQGILGLFIVGAYLLLAADLNRIRHWLRISGLGAVTLMGTITGTFLITPALHIHTKSAWRNILHNFEFIQNYNVPKDFLELPLAQKIRVGLSGNIPPILEALGWMLVACYLTGLAISARRWWAARKAPHDTASRRYAALILALALFPLFAVLVSTALKLEVQPFHFSYVIPPLCIVSGIGLHTLFSSRVRALRLSAILLLTGTLLQLGMAAWRENFFWKREDLQVTERYYAREAFQTPLAMDPWWGGSPETNLKMFRVEPPGLPVFRNKPARITHPSATRWRSVHLVPGPTIPMGDDSSWIVLDGPVLPRDDRTFAVPADRSIDRDIVLYDPVPDRLTLGIRSGSLPVEIQITGPGGTRTCRLDANTQQLLQIPTCPGRKIPADQDGHYGGTIITLSCHASLASAWVSVMNDPRELENFALTGGQTNCLPLATLNRYSVEDLSALASQTAFLESGPLRMPLTTNVVSLTGGTTALPAGRYILTCHVEGMDSTNQITLGLSDPAGWLDGTGASNTFFLGRGDGTITLEFNKPFTPHEVWLLASCPTGTVMLNDFTVRPDTETIIKDVRALQQGGPGASWMRVAPPAAPLVETPVESVSFDSLLSLTSYSMPLQAFPGETIRHNFRFAIQDYRIRDFHDTGIFVHLENAEGKRVCNLDIALATVSSNTVPSEPVVAALPLSAACFNTALMAPVLTTLPPDLAPGQYQLCMGLYNPSIRQRWPIKTDRYKVKKDSLRLGTLTVIPRP